MAKKTKAQKRRAIINKCDKLWSELIRSVGKCEICGATEKLQAHHLIDREYSQYRLDLDNGICLCAKCHRFDRLCGPHGGPKMSMLAVLNFYRIFKIKCIDKWVIFRDRRKWIDDDDIKPAGVAVWDWEVESECLETIRKVADDEKSQTNERELPQEPKMVQ